MTKYYNVVLKLKYALCRLMRNEGGSKMDAMKYVLCTYVYTYPAEIFNISGSFFPTFLRIELKIFLYKVEFFV